MPLDKNGIIVPPENVPKNKKYIRLFHFLVVAIPIVIAFISIPTFFYSKDFKMNLEVEAPRYKISYLACTADSLWSLTDTTIYDPPHKIVLNRLTNDFALLDDFFYHVVDNFNIPSIPPERYVRPRIMFLKLEQVGQHLSSDTQIRFNVYDYPENFDVFLETFDTFLTDNPLEPSNSTIKLGDVKSGESILIPLSIGCQTYFLDSDPNSNYIKMDTYKLLYQPLLLTYIDPITHKQYTIKIRDLFKDGIIINIDLMEHG